MDNDQALRALREVNAEVDKLDTKRADVKATADTSDAVTGLAEVAAEADAVDKQNVKLDSSSRRAGRGMSALVTAVIALGPAVVPLGAAATGAAAAFGTMGAAGIAAVYGIKLEMDSGSRAGVAFANALDLAKSDVQGLARVSAAGVLGPLQQSVAQLHAAMPGLTATFSDFATITGKSAALGVQGLLAAFQGLTPIMQTAAVYAYGLAQRFEGLMAGPGVVAFGSYAQSVFPQVVSAIEAIASAGAHLVASLAPLGLGIVSMLQVLADVLNAIPVDVLGVLAQGAYSVFLGFKAWSGLTSLIAAVGERITLTAAALSTMSIAAGAVGVAVALLTWAFTAHAEAERKSQQAVDDLTEALKQSNGAIDENYRKTLASQAAASGLADTARQLGVSWDDVTAAAQGNGAAMDRVNSQLSAAHDAASAAAATTGDYSAAMVVAEKRIDSITGFIANQNTNVDKSKTAYQDWKTATDQATAATDQQAVSLRNSALLHDASAASTDADRKALQQLNTEMDKAISKELTLAQSQTAVDQALLNMTEALKTNKGSMAEHTQAGIADRQAIEGAVGALQRQRDAQINAGTSTAEATGKYSAQAGQLLENIARTSGANSAAYAYARQLLQIPTSVTTTINANTASAYAAIRQVAATLDSLHDRTVYISTVTRAVTMDQANPLRQADGGIVHAYAGGGFERHVAQIAPAGAMRLWAEPETGGEAYIPLSPAKRVRSTAILAETNRMMGDPLGAGSMVGLAITGTLETPWGPSEIRGVVRDEIRTEARELAYGSA